ncbi:hypothetical protein LRS71_23440 [Rhodococcus pyridinivorans]|uniref:hypothetical protein n=1 Tax=Rhodococcus pyridinivorans TaxID=103816 RepID=UPI001E3F4BA2|nr:hypothetical protein [Rhodococcus pyridinivorans]MCD5422471.1 hypothetical protein [Rhodococcus pyridinivorans]
MEAVPLYALAEEDMFILEAHSGAVWRDRIDEFVERHRPRLRSAPGDSNTDTYER